MLKRVLLHLNGSFGVDQAIELGARISQRTSARLRGLSILDTSGLQYAGHLVSAAHAVSESRRIAHAERRQMISHQQMLHVGQRYQLDFDTLGIEGDPIQSLVREAQYYDLLITRSSEHARQLPGELSAFELLDVVIQSRQPVYISRGANTNPNRVLLVYDGSESSARVIRTFLTQKPIKNAYCRLLGVGTAADSKSKLLPSMRDYCEARHTDLEVGRLAGSLRKVLIPYAQKWDPDVVVMGVPRVARLWRRIRGHVCLDFLIRTRFDLYLMG
ncbi:Universal stress protein family protein [Bremerella volcania]|uniref:Universal stress protein family protein n=1 Tax=Bremerella volcania TaxID=2527984 RepID=A0A518CBT3_9BACT|nr:universal stress protein [Bremerella volcania]QDU76689.1 Universal stress protein family protein [Bremerella volcania]